MTHVILFTQTNGDPKSRTYTHYESLNNCVEEICNMYEHYLKYQNPAADVITYAVSDLFHHIDALPDLALLIYKKTTKTYAPYSKDWIKNKIYEFLRQKAERAAQSKKIVEGKQAERAKPIKVDVKVETGATAKPGKREKIVKIKEDVEIEDGEIVEKVIKSEKVKESKIVQIIEKSEKAYKFAFKMPANKKIAENDEPSTEKAPLRRSLRKKAEPPKHILRDQALAAYIKKQLDEKNKLIVQATTSKPWIKVDPSMAGITYENFAEHLSCNLSPRSYERETVRLYEQKQRFIVEWLKDVEQQPRVLNEYNII